MSTPHLSERATKDYRLFPKARESEEFAREANSSTIPAATILNGLSDGRQTSIEKN
jgi:hypothetical protein